MTNIRYAFAWCCGFRVVLLCIYMLCVLCVVFLLCCVVWCFGVCIMLCVCCVYAVCMLCVNGRCTSDVCNAAAPSALITWPPIFLYFSHRPHLQSIFDIWYQIRWPPIFPYFYHRWHQQSIFNIWYQITWPPIFPYFSHRWHQHKSWSKFFFINFKSRSSASTSATVTPSTSFEMQSSHARVTSFKSNK